MRQFQMTLCWIGFFFLHWMPDAEIGICKRAPVAVSASTEPSSCDPSFLSEAQTESVGRFEAMIFERINQIRRQHGLEPLTKNQRLLQVARSHSCRMAAEDSFGHQGASGGTPADRVRKAGLGFSLLGENIGKTNNVADPTNGTVEGWMQSEGHRENILNARFTQTGVGIWRDGRTFFMTQLFLRP